MDSAEILKLKGNFSGAITICKNTRQEAERTGDWANVARSLNELAEINRYFDGYDVSQKLLAQSRDVIKNYLDTIHVEMARNFFYQGKIQKDLRNEEDGYPKNVLNSYHKSESILKKHKNYRRELAIVILDMGRFYNERLEETGIAKEYYFELETILNDSFEKSDYYRGFLLYYTGVFYRDIADYERSTLVLSLARHIFSTPENYDFKRLLNCEIVIANNHFNQDEFVPALLYYRNVIDNDEFAGYSNLLSSYNNSGRALLELGKLDSSIMFSNKALILNESNNNLKEWIASYLNLGLAYAGKGNISKRDVYFDKALRMSIDKLGAKSFKTHMIYRSFGEYYEDLGSLDQALESYQEGLIALFDEFNAADIYQNPDFHEYGNPEEVFYILTEKSRALYKRFLKDKNQEDLEAAYELYKTGYDLLEKLLNAGMMDESMIQVFHGFKEAFNLSVECAFDIYEETGDKTYYYQAFQFIEKSKYFLLQKALASAINKENAGSSDDLFNQERQLSHDINALKYRLKNMEGDENTVFSTRNMLYEKLIEKNTIIQQIKQYSSTAPAAIKDDIPLSVEKIQNTLVKKNELIVEYHWTENYIYALSFTKSKIDLYKINITPEILNQINIYGNCITSDHRDYTTSSEFQKYIISAHFLYEQLLGPVLSQQKSVHSLTIVPDGSLSYLPFESMLIEFPDTTTISYWKLPYLLNEINIGYAYSLKILKNNRSSLKKTNKHQLLAFSYSSDFQGLGNLGQSRSTNELRYSAEELNSIRSWIKSGDYYEDLEATEALFKSKATDYSMIHLALHGRADVVDRYNSKLLFKDDSTTNEDGELHAYELYNLDLSNTEMVVLSACETGVGLQTEGEGIFSIARGFAYAGCPSIFMSLWEVNDKTTAKIMGNFYENLSKGMKKDKALRKAKLSYIEATDDYGSHPSKWAAFIALGNNKPIQGSFKWYYGLFILILLVPAYFIYSSRKKRA